MSWFSKIFGGSKSASSANIAKERLQVIVAHQRATQTDPDFFSKLQREIMQLIAKHVEVDLNEVRVAFDQQGDRSVLELNVQMPENARQKKAFPSETAEAKADAAKAEAKTTEKPAEAKQTATEQAETATA